MTMTEGEVSDTLLGSYNRNIEIEPSFVIGGYQEKRHR